jgi:hypothetical protein
MKTYILVGERGLRDLQEEDWESLEESILHNYDADIIAWDKETESLSSLLDMLIGWDAFVELSREDIEIINNNTKIAIL